MYMYENMDITSRVKQMFIVHSILDDYIDRRTLINDSNYT